MGMHQNPFVMCEPLAGELVGGAWGGGEGGGVMRLHGTVVVSIHRMPPAPHRTRARLAAPLGAPTEPSLPPPYDTRTPRFLDADDGSHCVARAAPG